MKQQSLESSQVNYAPGVGSSNSKPNMLDSMQRTGGISSQASFAYTSNQRVAKYSPVRNPNPGHQNVPMSYAGPPSQEELMRNHARDQSGNRNFKQTVGSSEQPQRVTRQQ